MAALSSMGDQQSIVSTLVDKWREDEPDASPAWEAATPTLLALRGALLERWEAEDRAELKSMQVFRMSYLYSVGILASMKKDALFDQVRGVITDELVDSDVAHDAKSILKRFFDEPVA